MNNLFENIPDTVSRALVNTRILEAALVESVHRWYNDHVLLSEKDLNRLNLTRTDVSAVGKTLSQLWYNTPDWRYILKQKAERYDADQYITSLPLTVRPPVSIPEKFDQYTGPVLKHNLDNFHIDAMDNSN